MSDFLTFLVIGLGAGGAYALAGQGIVLVYRGSGVINFSQGGSAVVAAGIFFELRSKQGWPGWLAAVIALGVCAVVGLAIHYLVMRPLRRASPLTRVIGTLGVLVVLQQIANLQWSTIGQFVAPFLPTGTLRFSEHVAVGWDRMTVFGLAAVLTVVLTLLYKLTDFGRSTTAVAENELTALSLGYSADKIAAINWMLGSVLAGVSGILLLQIISQMAPVSIVLAMIPGLAAALVGRFSSFGLTFLGGIVIGIAEAELLRFVHAPGWPTAAPFLIVIAVLVVRGRALPLRGHVLERLPSVGLGLLRPRLIGTGCAVAGLSLLVLSKSWQDAVATSMIAAIVILSVVVVTGYAGQISLAQYALAGFGALIASRLADAAHVPFLLAAGIGVLATIPLGLAVALPALRVRGVNLAVVTVGLALAIQKLVLSNPDYTGGPIRGTLVPEPKLFGWSIFSVEHPGRYTLVVLAAFALLAVMVGNLRRGPAGRRLLAVRANERAAAALGISVIGAKLYAFGLASAIAAVGGIFVAFRFPAVQFDVFDVFVSIYVVLWAVIGGVGYLMGAVLGGLNAPGGIGQFVLSQFFAVQDYVLLIGGILLLLIVIFMPNGQAAQTVSDLRKLLARLRRPLRMPLAVPLPHVETHTVTPTVLEATGLSVAFGGVVALDGVDLRVEPGQVTGLIGPNGAGKTTLIDVLAGNTRPRTGRVTLDGAVIDRWSVARRAARRTGSFLSITRALRGHDRRREPARSGRRSRARRLCEQPLASGAALVVTNGGCGDSRARPRGGSRADAIGAALRPAAHGGDRAGAGGGALRAPARRARRRTRRTGDRRAGPRHPHPGRRLGRRGAARRARRGTGHLGVRSDPRLGLRASPGLGDAGGHRRQPGGHRGVPGDAAHGGARRHTARGRRAARRSRRRSTAPRAVGVTVLLAARGLSGGYAGLAAVRDLDLEVHPGELVALIGPNGAGKTTTLMTLAGALPPIAGTVIWNGAPTRAPLFRRSRDGLGLIPETRSVIMGLSAMDNLRLGGGSPERALELFPELEPHLRRKAGLLSGGQQQILTLARALSRRPKCLLADELSLGLAPLVVDRLLAAVRRAVDDGVGVVIVEQHASKALEIADRAYVLGRGRVQLEGRAAELASRVHELEQTYLGGPTLERSTGGLT